MSRFTAEDECRKLAKNLDAKYPEAGISFSYLGNLDRQGNDGRTWQFLTKITKKRFDGFVAGAYEYESYGYHSTADLPALLREAKQDLELFVIRALDPAPSGKARVNNWKKATSETSEKYPGATWERYYASDEDSNFLMHAVVAEDVAGALATLYLNGERLKSVPLKMTFIKDAFEVACSELLKAKLG